eukprot:66663_1
MEQPVCLTQPLQLASTATVLPTLLATYAKPRKPRVFRTRRARMAAHARSTGTKPSAFARRHIPATPVTPLWTFAPRLRARIAANAFSTSTNPAATTASARPGGPGRRAQSRKTCAIHNRYHARTAEHARWTLRHQASSSAPAIRTMKATPAKVRKISVPPTLAKT